MAPEASSRKSFLVIDPDPIHREIVREIAAGLGFDVLEAGSMDEASVRMSERRFDVVAVDLSLGDLDGVEVIRYVAKSGQRPDIVVTSDCEDRIRDAVVRFGKGAGLAVIGDFGKPLNIQSFRRCLADATARADRKADLKIARSIPADSLRRAIADGEIYAVYQPQVELGTGYIVGVEALARWKSPEYGSVSPEIFVGLAERSGLAKQLSDVVLSRAVSEGSVWCRRNSEFRIAVNVSANVLAHLSFPDEAFEVLAAHGMDPSNLTVEVTEKVAMSDPVASADVMCRLSLKGTHLSIDDFGTGYSSLTSLLNFPFEELKIDRSFVSQSYHDKNAATIVQGTILMAKARGMRTVAEGIETQVVLDLLAEEGADIGQGYFFGRPMSAAEMTAKLG